MINRFGNCPKCGSELEVEWFKEYEHKSKWIDGQLIRYKTHRWRYNIDYLICPHCLEKQIVDDSYAGEWHQ